MRNGFYENAVALEGRVAFVSGKEKIKSVIIPF